MDISKIDSLAAAGGSCLNQEELYKAQNAATALSAETGETIKIWGKIEGSDGDYLIACSSNSVAGEFPTKKFYYSTVGDAGFVPLTSGGSFNDEHAVTGDPSLELAPETDESDAYTEANYVHNLVSTIDAETAIVPVGFMQVDGQNSLIEKATPSRISEVDALRVDSYRIMGTPPMWREQVASGKSADDILEVLGAAKKGESVRGCWKVVRSAGGSSVCVRNLFWPGFSAFYNVGTNSFGTMYIGTGHKNRDVPFML